MKRKVLLFLLLFLFSNNVYATNVNTPVSSNTTYDACVKFQDGIFTSNSYGYYGQCHNASCPDGTWHIAYFITPNIVTCSNGNKDMYKIKVNSGCDAYSGSCTPGLNNYKYCTSVSYFDCNRTSSGAVYVAPTTPTTQPVKPTTTTTTTKRRTTSRTTKTTTTTTTTTTSSTTTTAEPTTEPTTEVPVIKDNNTYLSSLKFSEGIIIFDREKTTYTIEISKEATRIEVEAVPESNKSKVDIKNNENININTPIVITVTAENGDTKEYTINLIYEEEEPSSNKIEKLTIEGYKLDFNSDKNSYSLKIDKNVKTLNFNITLEDEEASYEIIGNSNLKNGSKINIVVTGSDNKDNIYVFNIKKSGNMALVFIIIIVIGIGGVVAYKVITKLKNNNDNGNTGDYDYE